MIRLPRTRKSPPFGLPRGRWVAASFAALAVAVAASGAVSATAAPVDAADGRTRSLAEVYAMSLVAPKAVSSSGLVARAALPGATQCPTLDVDGSSGSRSLPMVQRVPGSTTGGNFDAVISCSAPIPRGTTSASVAGQAIPARLPAKIDLVAAFGDTGCRIDGPKQVQDCTNPVTWPFATTAQRVARSGADIAIHLGDYYYRMKPCPAAKSAECGDSPTPPAGVPFLDTAQGWVDDFFRPASSLLRTTPLLAMRGNHEACNEAGNGYYLYLDIGPDSAARCAPQPSSSGGLTAPVAVTPPWTVDFGVKGRPSLRLAYVDSTNGLDVEITSWWKKQRVLYTNAAKAAASAPDAWLLTHRPILGLASNRLAKARTPDWTPWTSVDQTAASRGRLAPYSMVWSAHEHLSQMVQVPGAPPQFIAGGGGTELDPGSGYVRPRYGALAGADGKRLLPQLKPYPKLADRWLKVAWGHAYISPSKKGWKVRYRSPTGTIQQTCRVTVGSGNNKAQC